MKLIGWFVFGVGFAVHPVSAQTLESMSFVNPIKICEEQHLSSNCFQFSMGSSNSELGRFDDEVLHLVTFTQRFEIQTTVVTRAQYFEVMGFAPPAWKAEAQCLMDSDPNGGVSCPNYPAENLSWENTQSFIQKLNQRFPSSPCTYRLPTEAEWEYSDRGATSSAYYFGDDVAQLGEHAWFAQNSIGHAHEVGKKGANSFGLYDMNGNVWQWVNDWYGDYDLQNLTNPQGPNSGRERVFRGGAWDSDPRKDMRSASRGAGVPNGSKGSKVNRRMGFRLVKECTN